MENIDNNLDHNNKHKYKNNDNKSQILPILGPLIKIQQTTIKSSFMEKVLNYLDGNHETYQTPGIYCLSSNMVSYTII